VFFPTARESSRIQGALLAAETRFLVSELTYWNHKSPGLNTSDNFIICVPGGVVHKGIDSTMYEWPVEENEYTVEELKKLRNKIN
jgi:hypothetical protein